MTFPIPDGVLCAGGFKFAHGVLSRFKVATQKGTFEKASSPFSAARGSTNLHTSLLDENHQNPAGPSALVSCCPALSTQTHAKTHLNLERTADRGSWGWKIKATLSTGLDHGALPPPWKCPRPKRRKKRPTQFASKHKRMRVCVQRQSGREAVAVTVPRLFLLNGSNRRE